MNVTLEEFTRGLLKEQQRRKREKANDYHSYKSGVIARMTKRRRVRR